MKEHVIEIVSEGEAPRTLALDERVVIGSGPSATLRLEGYEELDDAHVVIEPKPEGCRVTRVEGARVPLLVEGLVHDDGVLPWGTEITLGALRLRLGHKAVARRAPSPVVLFAAPLTLGLAMWMLLAPADDSALPTAPAHPALFGDAPSRCTSGRSPARHRAERDEHAAAAKSQRYPFAAHDGVEAVELYRHAAACFADSGDAASATRVRERAARLEARLVSDYDTARFRLSRALTTQDWSGAAMEARLLLELLADRPGPYTEWLTALERRLRLFHLREGASEGASG